MKEREIILAPSVALTTTPVVSEPLEVTGDEVAIEVATGTLVGGLKILVEVSSDGSSFFAPTNENFGGTPSGGILESVLSRLVKTFTQSSTNFAVRVNVRGYRWIRLSVYAGTSGSAAIYLNRLVNSGR